MNSILTYILLTASKNEIMLQKDPHGFVLTITSVFVVFCALIILRYAYGFIGDLNTGKISFKKKKKGMTEEEAAAIAMALSLEKGNSVEGADQAVAAAIALALNEELEGSVHDYESYVITIKR